MFRCESCGDGALTTVRWRNGAERRKFALCGEWYGRLDWAVWIVPGRIPVWGLCSGCSEWFSVRELSELRPAAWKWDAPSGFFPGCAGG